MYIKCLNYYSMRFERFRLYASGVKSPLMYRFFILISWSSLAFCRSRRGLMIFPWRICLISISFEICSSFIPRMKDHRFDLALKASDILLCQPNQVVVFMSAYNQTNANVIIMSANEWRYLRDRYWFYGHQGEIRSTLSDLTSKCSWNMSQIGSVLRSEESHSVSRRVEAPKCRRPSPNLTFLRRRQFEPQCDQD